MRDGPFREQEVIRRQALVVIGKGVPRVEDEQFVEQGGAGSPVADDEQRRLANPGAFDATAVGCVVQHAQRAVDDAGGADDGGDVPVGRLHSEAVADEQAQPGEQVGSVPQARRPLLLGFGGGRHGMVPRSVGAKCHSCNGEGSDKAIFFIGKP